MKFNIKQLYDKSPASALATLAAGAVLRGNDEELAMLTSRLHGRLPYEQLSYLQCNKALIATILTWALDCQTTYSQLLEYKLAALDTDDRTAQIATIMAAAMQRRLASLEAAMQQVCDKSGIAFDDVKTSAGIGDMLLREAVPAIPAAVKEFAAQYRVL